VQTIASREISPIDSIVVSVTILEAGNAHNVVPDTAHVVGTLRALNVNTFEYGVGRVQEIAAAVGHTFRCNVTVDWEDTPIYPPTVNDPTAWAFAKTVGSGCACRLPTARQRT
jgi:metal-dependent amidase/aminoacylase/carboxypeptidase family protein